MSQQRHVRLYDGMFRCDSQNTVARKIVNVPNFEVLRRSIVSAGASVLILTYTRTDISFAVDISDDFNGLLDRVSIHLEM